MPIKTHSFDPAEHLDTPEARAEYSSAALETDGSAFIADGPGVVARTRHVPTRTRPRPAPRKPVLGAARRRNFGVRHDHEGAASAGGEAECRGGVANPVSSPPPMTLRPADRFNFLRPGFAVSGTAPTRSAVC